MKNVKVLDCTLRDGAYLVDKTFGVNVINGIVNGLTKANIDIVEIGFLQDDGQEEGKTVYKNSSDAKRYVPNRSENTEFAVLADLSRYSVKNLDRCDGSSFTIVRACFFKKELRCIPDYCAAIKEKGYKVFVQPVDILGYSDAEIIKLIEEVNGIEPYCFSLVDTFGSMYINDLRRLYSLVNHNLKPNIAMGFHSHNNLQMSNALSQEFINLAAGQRAIVIDATLCGMGRGAGNTPTELILQYMSSIKPVRYDIDVILDTIDQYIDTIKAKCDWGYSIPYFIAGSYSAHVNNANFLLAKNSIKSKAIRHILNAIGSEKRKRYDYGRLEKEYIDYIHSDIDDSGSLKKIQEQFKDRNILIMAPGNSISNYQDRIIKCVNQNKMLVIAVNFIPDFIRVDYLYMSNVNRYNYWKQTDKFHHIHKIFTSNIECGEGQIVVSCNRLIKCGWEHTDNSMLMILRLFDYIDVKSISIAGFDGFQSGKNVSNYVNGDLELFKPKDKADELNIEIKELLSDYKSTRRRTCNIEFITPSIFEGCL